MYERECDDLIKTSRALEYLRKVSPSGRRDILIARIEQYLLTDPSFINELDILKKTIVQLESKVSILDKQLIAVKSISQEFVYKVFTPISFTDRLKFLFLG